MTSHLLQITNNTLNTFSTQTFLAATSNGKADESINTRIGKTRQMFCVLKPIWNNTNISLKIKARIFNR